MRQATQGWVLPLTESTPAGPFRLAGLVFDGGPDFIWHAAIVGWCRNPMRLVVCLDLLLVGFKKGFSRGPEQTEAFFEH